MEEFKKKKTSAIHYYLHILFFFQVYIFSWLWTTDKTDVVHYIKRKDRYVWQVHEQYISEWVSNGEVGIIPHYINKTISAWKLLG